LTHLEKPVTNVCRYAAGPVRSIERSPFFPDTLLSVGDWTFKLFKEGVKRPLFSSPSADTYLAGGCFSPTRPGVIFTAKMDGTLDIWDFLDRSHGGAVRVELSWTHSLKAPGFNYWTYPSEYALQNRHFFIHGFKVCLSYTTCAATPRAVAAAARQLGRHRRHQILAAGGAAQAECS
jgi:hypothetical protein